MKVIVTLLSIALALPLVGCKREAPSGAKASASTSTKKAAAKSPTTSGAVARIVFVDKEKACACTRERIDKSWKALTDVVGFPPVPEVERIHMDSQPEKAAPYKKQRPIMVPPAIYFFDKQNKLVQVLQGEVKSEQVRATLK
jgi:hypothetical protein